METEVCTSTASADLQTLAVIYKQMVFSIPVRSSRKSQQCSILIWKSHFPWLKPKFELNFPQSLCRYNLMTLLKTLAPQIYFCLHQRILISFCLQWQDSQTHFRDNTFRHQKYNDRLIVASKGSHRYPWDGRTCRSSLCFFFSIRSVCWPVLFAILLTCKCLAEHFLLICVYISLWNDFLKCT